MGRPKKDDSKKNRHCIRLSDDEEKMLEFVAERTGKSKTDVFRDGLRTNYNLEKFKLED